MLFEEPVFPNKELNFASFSLEIGNVKISWLWALIGSVVMLNEFPDLGEGVF